MKKFDKGIMLNWDITQFWGLLSAGGYGKDIQNEQQAVKFAESIMEQYKDTHVTDVMVNIFSQISAYPSRIMPSYTDNYEAKAENGFPAIPSMQPLLTEFKKWHTEYGIDLYEVWIKSLRKLKIKPWLSFRMSDAHNIQDPAVWSKEGIFHKLYNGNCGRMRHRRWDGYYDSLPDYGQEIVRNRILDYIKESIEKYDADGIELDWQREMFCFAPGGEYDILLKRIKAFHRLFEAQWMKENKPFGFDIQDLRLGGIIQRIESCRRRLSDYCLGRIKEIPELNEKILPFERVDGELCLFNYGLYAASAGVPVMNP